MPLEARWRRILRFWRHDVAADIDDELRFHWESRAEELRARGLPEADVARTIAEEFGDVEATRADMRAIDERMQRRRSRVRWWQELRADATYAVRGLRRQPGFAIPAMLTLALGVGAATAMLSVARAALVGLVPFPDAGQLVVVREGRAPDASARGTVSYAVLGDWRDGVRAFAALEGYDETNVTLTGVGEPARLEGVRVTPGFLGMLGARIALGRGFAPGGDEATVVVSHDFWRRRLGGDAAALARTITVDGRALTVVGVLAPGFRFAPAGEAEVWLPVDEAAARARPRDDRWLRVVGRLREGESASSARVALDALVRRLATRHPGTTAGRSAHVVPLRDEIVGPVRPLLLVLGGAVGVLLLVASTNVASLFAARALARRRELAMRVALGARAGRIVRQLLAESVLVALAGGAMGAALAWCGTTWLAAAAPAHVVARLPFLRAMTVDAAVLAGSAAVALACGVTFGVAPALFAARVSFAGLGRRDGGDGADAPRRRTRRLLVVAQVALTTVLLVGAGLMARSVAALLRVDPGFATERVATMRLALTGPRYADPASQRRFFEALVTRVGAIPGVRDAGAASHVPLSGSGAIAFRVEGAPGLDGASPHEATRRGVAGDYFAALGIRIVDGRALAPTDHGDAPRAIVVSEGLARRVFGGEGAIGRRVRLDAVPGVAWTVVGVAADVRATSVDAPATPTIYLSHLQAPENRMTIVARVAGEPAPLLAAMRRAALALDPSLPVHQLGTMAQQVADTPAVWVRRSLLLLLGGFAVAATLLAAVGLYGVTAYHVARRTRELGIHAALGATQAAVAGLVLRQGGALALAGIVAGLLAAGVLARGLGTLLYGVRPADAPSYAAAAALLAGVTLLALLVPARRAARIEPSEALRAD